MVKLKTILLTLLTIPMVSMANANDAFYQYHLGEYANAGSTIKQLATNNNQAALFYQGKMQIYGYAQSRNLKSGIELIEKSASLGYLPAQMFMGKYYLQLNKPDKAFEWFKKAAYHGNVHAQLFVVSAYFTGFGVKKHKDKARYFYIQAAKQGDPIAEYTLAEHFLESKHRKNRNLGKLWLIRSAKQNNKKAEYLLGKSYFTKEATLSDKQTGFNLILKSAKQGYLPAQFELIELYKKGLGTLTDEQAAENWQKQVEASLAEQEKRGTLSRRQHVIQWLSNGEHIYQFPTAYRLKGIMSDWHNQNAQRQGRFNLNPQIVTITRQQVFDDSFQLVDPNTIKTTDFIQTIGALAYKHKSKEIVFPRYGFMKSNNYKPIFNKLFFQASHGNMRSQYLLGQMYQLGLGVKKNSHQALLWYHKSAKQGYIKADYTIGLMYLEGDGVEKNYTMALKWLTQAAFRGNPYAQYTLGLIHETGYGEIYGSNKIPKDLKLAVGMYNLAAHFGFSKAQLNLADLYSSGLLNQNLSLAEKAKLKKTVLSLYENAVKQGEQEAELALAYFYAETNNPQKQSWAYQVASAQAKQGNSLAAFILAVMYDRGIGTAKNTSNAIKWYNKALDANNPVAEFILGTYYYTGNSVTQDKTRGIELLTKAAEQSLPFANYNLAVINYKENNIDRFLELLDNSAKQNYNRAAIQLADYYVLYNTNPRKLKIAADIYTQKAMQGYAKAQLKLGYLYEQGIFVNNNPKAAEFWLKQAAAHNNVLAQYLLGQLYQVGKLGERDIKSAKYWYQRAAKKQYVPAYNALGFIAETYEHSYQTALKWYTKAANANSALGEFNLGLMYFYGKGIKVDNQKAFKWINKASKNGLKQAEYAKALLHLEGDRQQINPRKAFDLFTQAADNNYANAVYQLALMREAGVGTDVNLQKALYYYEQAALRGNLSAKSAITRIQNGFGGLDKSSLSYVLPIHFDTNRKPSRSPKILYMQALNELNSGNVTQFISLISQIKSNYPHYKPPQAKMLTDIY